MSQNKSKSRLRKLKVGDLVTHALYGRDWIGIIIAFAPDDTDAGKGRKEKALIKMQPGTKYETFFDKNVSMANRITSSSGYVTINWLFKLEMRE